MWQLTNDCLKHAHVESIPRSRIVDAISLVRYAYGA